MWSFIRLWVAVISRHFPDEQAATKLIYLALIKADAKWQRNRTWTAPRSALKIHFGDRFPG